MSDEHTCTRAEFERDYATSYNNGGVLWPWRLLTWQERIRRVIVMTIAYGVVCPLLFGGALIALGMMLEGASERSTAHDRCLKEATNGYEIKQCR